MFIGHKKQIKFLEDSLRVGKITQSYIFSGPENIGKLFLAKMFAATLIKNSHNILDNLDVAGENKNQDIEVLTPEIIEKKGVIKIKDIDVEKVRIAQKNLALFPAVGKHRVLIIDDAHRLTISAQNALLKTLEEPSSAAIIILVTHEESRILRTIKSRCQKLSFNLVSLEEIKNGFRDKVEGNFLEKATIFSMGKPGEAKKIIDNMDNLKNKEEIANDLSKMRMLSVAEKLDLAQEYSKNLMQTREKLEFWIWMLRLQIFRNLNNKDNVVKNYLIVDKINQALLKIKNPSLNSRLILENLFLSL
ncbi:MAG: AAA family ATPase [Candidatus Moranbacteria bacterium]|jgi:DNA polymerase III gamma/tau subunit|nr:AAA family ATPase [Candidatus Moranbacteria bacterium]